MARSYLSLVALGANLPSSAARAPEATLVAALRMMHAQENISIHAASRFWRTPAVPAGSGPDYCNGAAVLRSDLPPALLLQTLHAIETRFGRDRADGPRWQSRPLDLDLIAVGDQVLPDAGTQDEWRNLPPDRQAERAPDGLILPHPRLQDRGFVLAPLAEIAPHWRHPRTGISVAGMLAALPAHALRGMRPLALTIPVARTKRPSSPPNPESELQR